VFTQKKINIKKMKKIGATVINKNVKNETPQKYFAMIAIFLVFGSIMSNMALRYVPFPTQVVGKGESQLNSIEINEKKKKLPASHSYH
jgi:hypothetical protein